MRNLAAVLLGILAGFIALTVVNLIGGAVFPTNVAIRLSEPALVKAAFASLPMALKLVMVLSYFAAGLAGGFVAKRIGGASWTVWLVAILFAVWATLNVAMLPMPAWMQAGYVLGPILGGALAHHFGPGRRVALTPSPDGYSEIED